MISYGPNLGLMENANTGEAHDAALRALLRGIDGLVMPNAKGYLTNTPPESPSDGDLYIIGAAPTGAWAGQGGKVARWSTAANAWEFYAPKNGWTIQSNSARETYRHTGGAWEIYYQEGTWTPTIKGTTTPGSHTYSVQAGNYTKIGRLWHVSANLTLTAKDAAMAGNVSIAGLPASAPTTAPLHSGVLGMWGNITLSAGYTALQTTPYGPSVLFTQCGSGLAAMNLGSSAVTATTTLRVTAIFAE